MPLGGRVAAVVQVGDEQRVPHPVAQHQIERALLAGLLAVLSDHDRHGAADLRAVDLRDRVVEVAEHALVAGAAHLEREVLDEPPGEAVFDRVL